MKHHGAVLLLLSILLIASAAQAKVTCGKEWITFQAHYTNLKTDKKDQTLDDPFFRFDARFTARKSEIAGIQSTFIDGKREDGGHLRLMNTAGSYFIQGQEYYEVIGCLN